LSLGFYSLEVSFNLREELPSFPVSQVYLAVSVVEKSECTSDPYVMGVDFSAMIPAGQINRLGHRLQRLNHETSIVEGFVLTRRRNRKLHLGESGEWHRVVLNAGALSSIAQGRFRVIV